MVSGWEKAKKILHTLQLHGYEAYIVGGAVRDLILKREISDVDIVSTATPREVASLFPKTYQLNNIHETILVREGKEQFEITTIRGHSIEADVKRRDLTINGLLLDQNEKVIDHVSGVNDLATKKLRSTLPYERMTEDPLRMLRVCRFVSDLGFSVDPKLYETIVEERERIYTVAIERIMKEWVKLLKGEYRNQALCILQQTELYRSLPQMNLTEHSLEQLSHLSSLSNESNLITLTAFCFCLEHVDEGYLKRLALSNELSKNIRVRLTYIKKRNDQVWTPLDLYYSSLEVAYDVERLRSLLGLETQSSLQLKAMWDSLPIHHRSELAVTGRDLLQDDQKEPGPWMKEALDTAERLVVLGTCQNDKKELIQVLFGEEGQT
ncbi:tRNA nucleotidyltransferase [Halalkalibacter wakoensis JCM 9140]|uniref:tRNA nucleotidyltransferase n=1 Tax=Halalkalibacter wakoensis JCM 9140 TaxID=1236970 RepID=W4Q104_9BACI|nr:CCA tRNA nucleotidyltransferase [Halalkalibacter wakoensis]GAE25049.1 tRNA nucleotidyltransferase [Halalkalibacter wakoensis JCM 9140]